jgi:hypothetical protein
MSNRTVPIIGANTCADQPSHVILFDIKNIGLTNKFPD